MRDHMTKQPSSWKLKFPGLLVSAWLLMISVGTARAQVAASISGRVEDASGAAVPAASVTVTNLETGAVRTGATDEGGNYRILSLPVGRYSIKAEKMGFEAALRTGVDLSLFKATTITERARLEF